MTKGSMPSKSYSSVDKQGRFNKSESMSSKDSTQEIVQFINSIESLKDYPIRKLVEHAQAFGPDLKRQKLETNQIRKFLDAINRVKANFTKKDEDFSTIEPEIVLLKPKLAYAAARQNAVKPFSRVMTAAIDKVHSLEDFERLVQLIESIIAYHKAAGGE